MIETDDYGILRQMIVLVRISEEESARTCAHMLSDLAKAEEAGAPCPGYVELLERARETESA